MTSKNDSFTPPPADRVKDSAQEIWLAGLGAFAKMREEGSKAFEALVKDGASMQKKTQKAAEKSLNQAQARMAGFASGWGKLENIFEERVARALETLGVPSVQELAALQARVEALEAQLKTAKSPAASQSTPRRTTVRQTVLQKTTASAESVAPAKKPLRRTASAAGRTSKS